MQEKVEKVVELGGGLALPAEWYSYSVASSVL